MTTIRDMKDYQTLSQAKQAMLQTALQPLQILLAVSLAAGGSEVASPADFPASLSSHLSGLAEAVLE